MKLAILLTLAALPVFGRPISDSEATAAIIGEAGNQPYSTQVAIGNVLRHRGNLKAVYGLHNPCVAKASKETRAIALKAWHESATGDSVKGCMYFGCKADADYFSSIFAVKVVTIGAISFYKP